MIVKGFIIGIAKVLPGVSGCLLAISLGIYEKVINILSNLKTELKKNYIFLLKLGIGFIIGVLLISKVLYVFINEYYVYTLSLLLGLLVGSIPDFISKIEIKFKYILFLFIGFILLILIKKINLNLNSNSYILLGIIEALSTIIPGLSGSALMIMLGNYNMMLKLLMNPFNFNFIVFIISFFITILIFSKIINYLLLKYKSQSYMFILGLFLYSIYNLFISIMHYKVIFINCILIYILFFLGILISYIIKKRLIS